VRRRRNLPGETLPDNYELRTEPGRGITPVGISDFAVRYFFSYPYEHTTKVSIVNPLEGLMEIMELKGAINDLAARMEKIRDWL
jgi:hypothetical protein